MWLKGSIKGLGERIDKKALGAAVGLMLISWAALPIVYYLLVRKKRPVKEVKTDVLGKYGCKDQKGSLEMVDNEMDKDPVEKMEEIEKDGNME